jgi:hypothetical protein
LIAAGLLEEKAGVLWPTQRAEATLSIRLRGHPHAAALSPPRPIALRKVSKPLSGKCPLTV